MESYRLHRTPEEEERLRRRDAETRVWWVEFPKPVERLWCDGAHLAAAHEADYGVPWLGLETHHHPRQLPTDRPDVWLLEYGIAIDHMAVAHQWMRGWMEVVRANGVHGRYREAGVYPERWYEF